MSGNLKNWRQSASLILAAKSIFSEAPRCNYKILCLKRSSNSKFMPETYVFPGGNICKSDKNPEWMKLYEKFGFSKESFDDLRLVENVPTVLQNSENDGLPKYLSFRICAIRETFEECGILLCKTPEITTTSQWASFVGGREFIPWQHRVHDDPDEFLNLCKQFGFFPDVWALKNWSNWVTPPSYLTLKFNTIFFIATLHQMPTVKRDEREIQDLMWTTPDEGIQMNNQEAIQLPVPQFYEISRLRTVDDIDALSAFASERAKFGFETYWPYRLKTDEGLYSILPGDELYPEKIDKGVTDIPHVTKLPGSLRKNRILHKSQYSNLIEIENFRPKCNHISPV